MTTAPESLDPSALRRAHADLVARGLALDLTRGKPSAAQLDLSADLLHLPDGKGVAEDGTDVRNYGGAKGLVELRRIFAELLGVDVEQLLALDNSSLSIMHDVLTWAWVHGIGGEEPWAARAARGEPVRWICPVPGYDRHFAITEHLGIEMVPVPIGEHGPDVAEVARLAADPSVKGMWVVPMYANPTGTIYDEATVRALVEMEAAVDFRIVWDNAYALHHLTATEHPPLDVLGLAAAAGHPDRVVALASTSKVTFAGGGVSFLAGSSATLDWYLSHAAVRTIGPDKVNQLRHALFFGDAEGVRRHMRAHRDLLAPKFDVVERVLAERLGGVSVDGAPVATWNRPEGGYFVDLDVLDHTAARVVALAKEAGVALTPAGSAFPHRQDPRDRNIRIAPSFPPVLELEQAMEALATCVLLAAAEKREGSTPRG